MTAQFQFFQSLPHKKADFVKKSRPNMGYSFFLKRAVSPTPKLGGHGVEGLAVESNSQRQGKSENSIPPMGTTEMGGIKKTYKSYKWQLGYWTK